MCQFPQCAKKKSADRRDRNRGSQEGNLRRRRLKDGMMKEKKECKKKETDRLLLVRGIGSFKAPSNELCTQKEINTADDWGDVDYCLRTIGHQSVSSSYNAQSRDAWATLDDGISRKKKKEEKRKERKEEEEERRKEPRKITRTNGQMQSSVLRTASRPFSIYNISSGNPSSTIFPQLLQL